MAGLILAPRNNTSALKLLLLTSVLGVTLSLKPRNMSYNAPIPVPTSADMNFFYLSSVACSLSQPAKFNNSSLIAYGDG
jgi:hypothetical protein